MLGTDVVVIEAARLIYRQFDHLLGARRQANITQDDTITAPDDKLDRAAHFVQLDSEIVQHLRRDPFTLADKAKEEMLSPDVIMVEALGFFLREAQDFARSLCKLLELIVHLTISPFVMRGRNRVPPTPGTSGMPL